MEPAVPIAVGEGVSGAIADGVGGVRAWGLVEREGKRKGR
jgi:hypothetical protein